jgi:hypothetical protein
MIILTIPTDMTQEEFDKLDFKIFYDIKTLSIRIETVEKS